MRTHREYITKFLKNVTVDPDDETIGWCDVRYTFCPVGDALVNAGHIEGARLYASPWLSCAFDLPGKLKALALERFYFDLDNNKNDPRIAAHLTDDDETRALLGRMWALLLHVPHEELWLFESACYSVQDRYVHELGRLLTMIGRVY